ncbi:hypothetical protein IAU60_002169 [Kwoniella sp. DSM 27419]
MSSERTNLLASASPAYRTEVDSPEPKRHHNIAGLSALHFRLICLSLWSGTFLSAFDSTLVSTILSDIGNEFNAATQVSWLGTSYLLSVCCFTPIYGRLSDLIGRRNAHLTGLAAFTLGTLLCGLAPNLWTLILARGIAGIGGGGVASVSTIVISDMVGLRRRGIYQGYVNILFGTGAALGGPVGGWISDHFGWRAAFNIQVPLLLLCCLSSYSFIRFPHKESAPDGNVRAISKASAEPRWKQFMRRIDYLGSLTLIPSVGALLLAMSFKTSDTKPNGQDYAFSDPLIWGLLVVSGLCTLAFILVEGYYAPEPILPLGLLTRRTPLAVALSSFLMVTGQFSVLYNIPLFFTVVQEKSSSVAGAHLLPNSILIGCGSLFAGWRMRHTGQYWTLGIGCASLMVLSSVGMAFWRQDAPEWLTWTAQAPLGLGYAGVLTTTLVALMTHVTRANRVTYLFRTVGQVLGVAISAAIVQSVVQRDLTRSITGPDAERIIYTIRHSTSSIKHLDPSHRCAAERAYDHALHVVFMFNVVLFVLTVFALALIKEEPMENRPGQGAAEGVAQGVEEGPEPEAEAE